MTGASARLTLAGTLSPAVLCRLRSGYFKKGSSFCFIFGVVIKGNSEGCEKVLQFGHKMGSANQINIYQGQGQQTVRPGTYCNVTARVYLINTSQAKSPGSTSWPVIRLAKPTA